MAYLRISPPHAVALELISKFASSDFKKLVNKLTADVRPSIKVSALVNQVSEISGDNDFANALCAQLISLTTYRRIQKDSTKDVVDALIAGIEKSELSDEILTWFVSARDDIQRLLECDCVKLPAKALHLSTDYDQIYASGNVVTDVRPVFDNKERSSIAGAIVTQSLKIHYISGSRDGQNEINLALDIDDIDKLITELEKAKQKAQCAKQEFSKKGEFEVFVIGEETYGFG